MSNESLYVRMFDMLTEEGPSDEDLNQIDNEKKTRTSARARTFEKYREGVKKKAQKVKEDHGLEPRSITAKIRQRLNSFMEASDDKAGKSGNAKGESPKGWDKHSKVIVPAKPKKGGDDEEGKAGNAKGETPDYVGTQKTMGDPVTSGYKSKNHQCAGKSMKEEWSTDGSARSGGSSPASGKGQAGGGVKSSGSGAQGGSSGGGLKSSSGGGTKSSSSGGRK